MSNSQKLGAGEERKSLAALNHSTRGLIDTIRKVQAPAKLLDEARAAVDQANELLAPHIYGGPLGQASLEGGSPMFGEIPEIADLFPYSALVGIYNPLAPPLEISVRDGVVYGKVVWGTAFCGPPNHVHGGMVAAAFDELLGAVNVVNRVGAMTGTLTIRYRKPTPLLEEIRMEGRHTGVDGRKVYAEGKMWHGDVLLAEAEGIFIQIAGEFRTAMLAHYQRQGGDPEPGERD